MKIRVLIRDGAGGYGGCGTYIKGEGWVEADVNGDAGSMIVEKVKAEHSVLLDAQYFDKDLDAWVSVLTK